MRLSHMRLSQLSRPFIVCVITDTTTDAAIATMRLAHLDGADAYELNLPLLAASTFAQLCSVFTATNQPVYTSCRRREFLRVYGVDPQCLPAWNDFERMERQLSALKAGSVALDMELDCFDPHPAPAPGTLEAELVATTPGPPFELSESPAAVERQREVVAAAHAVGAEVIMSCHTGRPQNADALVRIAHIAVNRGADFVKIVSPCQQIRDLLALLEATSRLSAILPCPFTLIGSGFCGQLSRLIGPTLGSGWVLAQQSLKPGGFHEQPLVAQGRKVLQLIPWRFQACVSQDETQQDC